MVHKWFIPVEAGILKSKCYLCNAKISFLNFKVNTFRVVFQLKSLS